MVIFCLNCQEHITKRNKKIEKVFIAYVVITIYIILFWGYIEVHNLHKILQIRTKRMGIVCKKYKLLVKQLFHLRRLCFSFNTIPIRNRL